VARLTILVLLVAVAAPLAAAQTLRPRIVVTDDPVAVRGTGFRAGEHVRVKLSAGATYSRRVTATARGTFRVVFPSASIDSCRGYTASAIGDGGSRAWLKIAPECPLPTPPLAR
jgi:hypothetical protein